ncbi:hypothetical protein U9M48_000140 [Paspalum notatum var. saurae]|uniref:Uncharacterized protein n=1 Tax=Paspalum notatum var. saurae TaxID=547442 RepID=A0AAQ3SEE6_PASNO
MQGREPATPGLVPSLPSSCVDPPPRLLSCRSTTAALPPSRIRAHRAAAASGLHRRHRSVLLQLRCGPPPPLRLPAPRRRLVLLRWVLYLYIKREQKKVVGMAVRRAAVVRSICIEPLIAISSRLPLKILPQPGDAPCKRKHTGTKDYLEMVEEYKKRWMEFKF